MLYVYKIYLYHLSTLIIKWDTICHARHIIGEEIKFDIGEQD